MWSRPIKSSPIHDCSDRGWNQRTIIVEYTLQHSLGRSDELAAQRLEAFGPLAYWAATDAQRIFGAH
jgi:hypothetical protein